MIASQHCASPSYSPKITCAHCLWSHYVRRQKTRDKAHLQGQCDENGVKKNRKFFSLCSVCPTSSSTLRGSKKLLMNRMKAVELAEATEPSSVLHSDCLLCSTGCCISTRQWVSSLFVLAGLLRRFKRIEPQAFSSSRLFCQCEWVWYSIPCQLPLFVFHLFLSFSLMSTALHQHISVSGHNVSVFSGLLVSLSVYSIQIYVASLYCHIMSCPVSSIKLQWTLPAFNLCWWVETSCLHMNIHGCVCKRDTYRGW